MSSSEPPGNVGFRLLLRRFGEQLLGAANLDQIADVEERGVVRDAAGLLQVMRDDDDGVAALELVAQLLDPLRAGGIERGRRLVEQQHFGLGGERARDAEALLLAARQDRKSVV